jgi:hypothetical protein
VFGGLQKNSWALPITTLKLGLAGVSKVSLFFFLWMAGTFFEEPGISINQSFQINPSSDSSDGLGMTHRDIHFPCQSQSHFAMMPHTSSSSLGSSSGAACA